jgi:hypothetical protein
MSKSTTFTRSVSTAMLLAATQGFRKSAWSWPTIIVVRRHSSRCSGPRLMRPRPGNSLALPIGSGGISVIPNVGQRGARPSVRSKVPIGKFVSTPPSTSVDTLQSAAFWRTGSKKNGIDIDARTASTTG